ncbi:MAG: LPP20 family lipoprotein [Thermodesulfobacteriota bacterium]
MNHKRMALIMILFVLAAVLAGCSKAQVANEALSEEFEDAPDWVLGEQSSEAGALTAVGSAKVGKGGVQFARTEAMAHARTELSQQLAVKVKALVSNFSQQVGMGEGQSLDMFTEQISKQVTNETISGSKQKELWISPASDLYVLVCIDPEMVKASVKNRIITSFKGDEIRWQKFQAQNGSDALDKEIEKTFGTEGK